MAEILCNTAHQHAHRMRVAVMPAALRCVLCLQVEHLAQMKHLYNEGFDWQWIQVHSMLHQLAKPLQGSLCHPCPNHAS